MAKSIKRAIATLLAVLMVAFSMPFSALAAAGDYEPDIELMFFPVWTDAGWGDYGDVTGAKGKDVSYHITDGAGDVALDYNKTAGTLTLSASKAATYLELNEMDIADTILADGDYTLGEGDYFAATVICKNISTLFAISGAIRYSDSIVPAGVYVTQTGTGTRRIQTAHLAAVSDFDDSAVSTDGPYFDDFSAAIYGGDTEMNAIDDNGNIFFAVAGESPYTDVSAVDAETAAGFMDPTSGDEGWDAAGSAIMGTYIFKIVSDEPITFEAADPNNTVYDTYAGGLYIANEEDGIKVPDNITTVAGGTHAGASKMTYFAEESETPACEHAHTTTSEEITQAATCTEAGSKKVTVTCDDCGATVSSETVEIPALGHDYQSVVTAPTCTEAGFTTYTCSRCQDTYTGDETSALGHDFGEWTQTTAPTCTEAGEETRYCSRCDATETRPVDATGHTPAEAVDEPGVAATCTEDGYHWSVVYCSVCDAEISKEKVTDTKLGHDFGEWTQTTAPTCTEAGEETRYCSRCDATETRPVEALGHDYQTVVTAPTCTDGGYTTYTCSRCGDTYTADETEALGHDLGEWAVTTEAVAPSCTEAGATAIETRTCSRCDYSETRGGEEVAALGHDFGEWTQTTAPSCTEAGEETRYCSRCDATETRPVDALGHDYVAVVTEPTCTDGGYTTYTCSRCGDTYTGDETAALGHDLGEWAVTTEAVAPSCTEAGATAIETRTCSRCDYSETRGGEEVAALGHDYVAVVTEPTCTDGGYTTYTCSRCGDTYTADETEALGHDMGEWQSAGEGVAPTCTQDGVDGGEVRYCSRCDYNETRGGEVIPALGHDFGEWTQTTAPTCTEAGEETRYCSRCDATETRPVEALGHDYQAVVTEPTCTDGGYTTYTCSRCGDTYTADETEALGHDLGEWTVTTEAVAPSCTEAGATAIETRTCSRCDYSETRGGEEVAALGHDLGEWTETEAAVAPTRTNAGKTAVETRTCSRCEYSETRGGDTIPALEGYLITVTDTEFGTATISANGAVDYEGGKLVKEGVKYTVSIEPNGDAEFIGWAIGNRIVSETTTYDNYAYSDLELTPKFAKKVSTETIVFVNKYNDIIATETVGDVNIPAQDALKLPGYDFVQWKNKETGEIYKYEDGSVENIRNLEKASTIVGEYKQNKTDKGYTITADGAEIILPAGVTNGSIPFDTWATVTFEGATAIKCGDEIVSYNDTYEFYVGADVTLEGVYEEVEEAVNVKILGYNFIEGTANKWSVFATRTVPDSWTAIDRGFVYGLSNNMAGLTKESLQEENALDNVPTGVRVSHGDPTDSEQFGLKIGINNKKTVRLFAYVSVKNAAGKTMVVVSDPVDVTGK